MDKLFPLLEYKLYKNRKDGINLYCDGYVYRKKANYRSSINWVCAKAPYRDETNKLITCPGRCVTNEDGIIKLSKKGHNHEASVELIQDGISCPYNATANIE